MNLSEIYQANEAQAERLLQSLLQRLDSIRVQKEYLQFHPVYTRALVLYGAGSFSLDDMVQLAVNLLPPRHYQNAILEAETIALNEPHRSDEEVLRQAGLSCGIEPGDNIDTFVRWGRRKWLMQKDVE